MLLIGLLLNALAQFSLYAFVGVSWKACIFGFLVGAIFMVYSSIKSDW
ncbi:hypothetical protein VPHK24_0041 [Vibrio phage K24]|nr:hypothetical protein SIPHO078v2_p0031 [Vibrio phage 14E30.1]QZI92475.1 hypothetical protein SIPHO058v2_p0027 [Vibrio phage 14E30.2]